MVFEFGPGEISMASKMLREYALQERFGEERNAAATEAFGDADRLPEETLSVRSSMVCEEAFLMWFAFERPIDEQGGTLVDRFLRDSFEDLTPVQRAYVERLRKSCLRPYELLAGNDPYDIAVLRDLWSDELVPLEASVRAHGSGMVFARVTIGQNGMPKLLEALAMPKAEMEHALVVLRIMHHDFRKNEPESHDDDFFKFVTPWMLRAWLTSFLPQRKLPAGKRIAQIKVVLDGIRPHIWRRLLIPEGMPLKSLSDAIERAMGWESYHLHEFDIDGVAYGMPDPEFPLPVHAELDRRLSDFHLAKGERFAHRYDFGDGWLHRILLEKFLEPEPGIAYPVCIAGARACPPEDVGGPAGYRDLLKALRNLKHRDHQEMKRWSRRKGRDYDPERFDVAAVNKRLRRRVIVPA